MEYFNTKKIMHQFQVIVWYRGILEKGSDDIGHCYEYVAPTAAPPFCGNFAKLSKLTNNVIVALAFQEMVAGPRKLAGFRETVRWCS